LGDLRAAGELETKKLIYLLRDVENKEQLQKKIGKIQQSYTRIAELVLELRKLSTDTNLGSEPSEVGDALFMELARLYEMPGCRRLLETAQEDAIYRLSKS